MANPNMLNAVNVYGVSNTANVSTVSSALITVPSSTLYKVTSFHISNYSSYAQTVTAQIVNSTRTPLANTTVAGNITIPPASIFVVYDKNTILYMNESDAMYVNCSSNGSLTAIISYEAVS